MGDSTVSPPHNTLFSMAGAAQIANSVHTVLIMPVIIITSNNIRLGEEGDQKYHRYHGLLVENMKKGDRLRQ